MWSRRAPSSWKRSATATGSSAYDGLVVGVAAQQAHRAAAAQVDRGDHDHGWATAFTNRS